MSVFETASRPKLLDVYCCQGGAGVGYQRAGFDVYAVDLDGKHQKRNPFPFHRGNALTVLAALIAGYKIPFTHKDGTVEWLGLSDFAAIHTSPPCQGYTIATAGNPTARAKHERLIAATRDLLVQTGLPWVIENVENALSQMIDPIMLCGRMFGLAADDADGHPLVLDRHRLFESNIKLTAPEHPKHGDEQVGGVYGGSRRARREEGEGDAAVAPRDRHAARYDRGGGYVPRSKRVQEALLRIDWMTQEARYESIPPVYAEHVGAQLMRHLEAVPA